MAGPNDDPNLIDISLGMADAQSIAAMTALTQQLQANQTLMKAMTAQTPQGYAQGQQAAAGQVSSGASQAVPATDDKSWAKRLGSLATAGGRQEAIRRYGAREREQYNERVGNDSSTDPHLYALRGAADPVAQDFPGGVSSGASTGSSDGFPQASWRASATADPNAWARAQERLQTPQFGNLTFQDKLAAGSGFLLRRAEGQRERAIADPNATSESIIAAGQRSGNAGMLLQMGADQAGQFQAVAEHVRGAAQTFHGMTAAGTSLGLERGGVVGIGGYGFSNPFSEANREGIHEKWSEVKNRARGGVTGDEAKRISELTRGYGWEGDENSRFQSALGDLQSEGIGADDAAGLMDQSVRLGNASIEEVTKTLTGLNDAARTANVSLSVMKEQMSEFVDFGQAHGATAQGSQTLGTALTNSNGLAPGVNAQIMDSQLFKGVAGGKGFLPEQVGLMGANQVNETMYEAVDLAMNSFAGYANAPDQVDPKTGEVISGKDRQIGMAAAQVNMSPDALNNLLRNKEVNQNGSRAQGVLKGMNTQITKRKDIAKRNKVLRANGEAEEALDPMASLEALDGRRKQAMGYLEGMAPGSQGDTSDEERVEYFKKLRGLNKLNRQDFTKQATDFANEARKKAGAQDREDGKVMFDLTSDAKRLLKPLHKDKDDARKGGISTAQLSSTTGLNFR